VTASVVEIAAVQPATNDNAAPVLIAIRTTSDRPQRCADSFPVMEIITPTSPATVNSIVGSGNHGGEPCHAMTVAKKVTPQARTTAISQV
jgi:hypothetical protein